MNKEKEIYQKINEAVKILCDVYDILNANENMDIEKKDKEKSDLMSIKQFLTLHDQFTDAQIRHYIYQNINNFKEKVTRRIGKKIYLNEKLFFEWIEEN